MASAPVCACHGMACATVILFLLSTILLSRRYPRSSTLPTLSSSANKNWQPTHSSVQLSGKSEIIDGTQIVWQIPASPKALLFIAHGCHCRATFFWDKSAGCPDCIGLPEERILVTDALSRRYSVVAISSTGTCWSFSEDKHKVKAALGRFIAAHDLGKFPVVALGASSGGYFVSSLASEFEFEALVLMISEGTFARKKVSPDYPPTLFVHMPKDEIRAMAVEQNVAKLKEKGVHAAEIKCYSFPVTPHLFTKIPGLDVITSENIFHALKEINMLDDNGYMKVDGRSSSEWQKVLKMRKILPLESGGRIKWEAHIRELLNVAYGYHEMTSLQSDDIFQWFDSYVSNQLEHLPKRT